MSCAIPVPAAAAFTVGASFQEIFTTRRAWPTPVTTWSVRACASMDCTVAVSVTDGPTAAGVAAGEGGAALAVPPDRNIARERIERGARRPMPRVIRNLLEGGPGEPPTTREPSRLRL